MMTLEIFSRKSLRFFFFFFFWETNTHTKEREKGSNTKNFSLFQKQYVPRFHSRQRKQSKNKVTISITREFHATWQGTNGHIIVEGTSWQRRTLKVADTWNLRVDFKIDRNLCYLFPGEGRCAGMKNMELATTEKSVLIPLSRKHIILQYLIYQIFYPSILYIKLIFTTH